MRKKFFVLGIIALLLLITFSMNINYESVYFDYINTAEYDEEPYNSNSIATIPGNNLAPKCNPFIKNSTNFYIKIDNVTYPRYLPQYLNKTYNFDCLNKNKHKKLILFWNKWFNDATFNYGLGKSIPFMKNNCPVTNCEITNDKKRLRESNAIIFHMRDRFYRLPKYRRPDQRWIFLLYESPLNSENFDKYNNLFNLTATYRSNSDFVSYYYTNSLIKWGENLDFNIDKDFSLNKTGFAAIIVSNCKDKSQRMEFINELRKYIPVDIYGKCGQPCPEIYFNGESVDCKKIIAEKYKFFLSFENSVCKDYITEKFFDTLKYDIVPVTYGGGPYDLHVPKSGYIDAFDYDNAESLANYLLYLNSSIVAYNKYFEWKKYLIFDENSTKHGHICELCIRLNLDYYLGIQHKVISDMKTYWGDDKNCYPV